METLFNMMPDWMKSKLCIRIIYTASSFITARIVAFLTGDYLGKALSEVCEQVGKVGIPLTIHVGAIDQLKLQSFITGILMIAAEWVIQNVHENHVLPIVAPQNQPQGEIKK